MFTPAQGPIDEVTTVPQLIAADTPAITTIDVPFLAAQGAFAQYAPLTYDPATGTYIAWVADAALNAIAAYPIQRHAVYTAGCFNIDAIAWPEGTSEEAVKKAMAHASSNSMLVFRKLLFSDKRIAQVGLEVGDGDTPPPEVLA
jgi:hypothetical protein